MATKKQRLAQRIRKLETQAINYKPGSSAGNVLDMMLKKAGLKFKAKHSGGGPSLREAAMGTSFLSGDVKNEAELKKLRDVFLKFAKDCKQRVHESDSRIYGHVMSIGSPGSGQEIELSYKTSEKGEGYHWMLAA